MSHAPTAAPEYHEPAQSYRSAWALSIAFVAGFVADLALGRGMAHIWAWLLAVVLVVGIDVLVTRAARTARSITVTRTELLVGEHSVPRESIAGIADEVDPTLPVLGQTVGQGLARGVPGLAVRLVGGEVLVVPTRHPRRVAAAIGAASAPPEIRRAEPDDLAALPEIDQRAESLFRVAGLELPEVAFNPDELSAAQVVFVAGRPAVGFAWIDELDGAAHLKELAVIPGRMRQGLGTALVEAACAWAASHGYAALTLTTFAEVSWNAPFYAARDFSIVDDITPGLAALRAQERAAGLDAVGARVVMRREL